MQGDKYPGEQFSLTMKMTDEMNQSASGFLQLGVKDNNQVGTTYTSRCISPIIVTGCVHVVNSQIQDSPFDCLLSIKRSSECNDNDCDSELH